LGLAVVHGIVAAHGGAITVDSTPGAGTTLRAYFPLQEGGVLPADVTGEQSPPPVPPARVLFVDDEPQIVTLVTELLSAAGHLVTGCVDPLDALATFTTRPADFDVLVSDFNMPRLSGLELAARVRALRQDLPIALVSGYVTPELQQRAAALGIGRVLHKSDLADEVCATIGTLTR
ncbi:MAG: response regulator, partial [Gammaproteobacteria bacterium]